MADDIKRMKELVDILNEASRAYYQGKDEIMSNYEYDALYDELLELEKKTATTLSSSPTVRVGYEVVSELEKEAHPSPMLSLDKTKDPGQLPAWLDGHEGLLSWKMDGLTIVLTYEDGKLVKAVTRGNGMVGEVITGNAKVFKNLPVAIPFKKRMTLRGEAVISYSEFERINKDLSPEERYKNPRNLCSGTVRQLNSEVVAKRNVEFYAFALVEAEGQDFKNRQSNKMEFMKSQGFETVEYVKTDPAKIEDDVKSFEEKIPSNDFPTDGLVLLLEDIAYGESLGSTSKFPRNAIALKWADETADTRLIGVEWSASRTGLINPVAVFEPVELEGTDVSRASVHNVSIVEQLGLGAGDIVRVYKANMIIPQIAENITRNSVVEIPEKCPVCGGPAVIHEDNGVKVLMCENAKCPAKKIKSIVHFASRDAMNIDGMSEATIEKFIAKGIIRERSDVFKLKSHKDEIVAMDGFGKKSYDRLVGAADGARESSAARFLYSLGVPGIGPSNAAAICAHFDDDFEKVRGANEEELMEVDGVGSVMARAFTDYFSSPENAGEVDRLLECVSLKKAYAGSVAGGVEGLCFVITGGLNHFAGRSALKGVIEAGGGRVASSVSSRTDYLINNNIASGSSKNKKAKELGIPIISEEEFMEKFDIMA